MKYFGHYCLCVIADEKEIPAYFDFTQHRLWPE
jgi:hypothetical protein